MLRISKRALAAFLIAVFIVGGTAGFMLYETTSPGGAGKGGNDAASGKNTNLTSGTSGSGLSADAYEKLTHLETYLKDNYYRTISGAAIETGLMRGLFSSPGDPYTIYYTKEEFEQTMEKTHGEISGVGLTLMPNTAGAIEVVSVVEGSPADKAGILAGDLLLSVDGRGYSGLELTQAVDAARGAPGTTVLIGISRAGKHESISITRATFVTPTVERELIDGAGGAKLGYVKVSSFNDNTASDFEAALKYMNAEKVKGIVIDVRNNAGGLVDKAVEMDGMLIEKGVICYAEDGKGGRITYEAEGVRATDLPYVIIIDGTSVSAAEIFALGVKANGGGKLVGQTTYGKGLIQKLEKFADGDGARITIMQYLTPDGEPVNGVGISPDIEVEQKESGDAQLDKAVELLSGDGE